MLSVTLSHHVFGLGYLQTTTVCNLGATAERVPRKSPQGDASEAGIIVYLDERAVCETDVKATIGHVARLRLRSKTTEAAQRGQQW